MGDCGRVRAGVAAGEPAAGASGRAQTSVGAAAAARKGGSELPGRLMEKAASVAAVRATASAALAARCGALIEIKCE